MEIISTVINYCLI